MPIQGLPIHSTIPSFRLFDQYLRIAALFFGGQRF